MLRVVSLTCFPGGRVREPCRLDIEERPPTSDHTRRHKPHNCTLQLHLRRSICATVEVHLKELLLPRLCACVGGLSSMHDHNFFASELGLGLTEARQCCGST